MPPAPRATVGSNGSSSSVVLEEEAPEDYSRRELMQSVPSFLVSMVFHLVLMLALAFFGQTQRVEVVRTPFLFSTERETPLLAVEPPVVEPVRSHDVLSSAKLVEAVPEKVDPGPLQVDRTQLQTPVVELDPLGRHAAGTDLLAREGLQAGNALSGRGEASRGQLVSRFGGNRESEAAVALALKWLAKHRMSDGGWTMQLGSVAGCKCANAGELPGTRIAATGLALLPFLGAGQTHREGEYRAVVREGIYYLIRQMRISPLGGGLNEPGGSMYSHGIASIALCEAYAMTGDKALQAPAQQAVNFICRVQDPLGGGWRYMPFQPGDTSVVGWQIMALKSALYGRLQVDQGVLRRASAFLDSVQMEEGAIYGYTYPASGAATTAIGLLCRMHLGWSKDTPALQRGVALLSQTGPSMSEMYYNYYATQVLRHWEGPVWTKWNQQLRDYLVATQAMKGHERGSWFIPGSKTPFAQGSPFPNDSESERCARTGGRLYCTAMATMILEVYYRHMPIYTKKSLEAEFPE